MSEPTALVTPHLRVLLIETETRWIAKCLNHDTTVEADSFADVLYGFERAVVGHCVACHEKGEKPFKFFPPADGRFWQMWEDGGYATLVRARESQWKTDNGVVKIRAEYRVVAKRDDELPRPAARRLHGAANKAAT